MHLSSTTHLSHLINQLMFLNVHLILILLDTFFLTIAYRFFKIRMKKFI